MCIRDSLRTAERAPLLSLFWAAVSRGDGVPPTCITCIWPQTKKKGAFWRRGGIHQIGGVPLPTWGVEARRSRPKARGPASGCPG
eukprot:8518022-Alexandrium_andersonii.AAC.1